MSCEDESLCRLGAQALLDGYLAGEFQPSQVVDAYLARIARLDPKLHAYVIVLADEARAQAEASDLRYRASTARALEGLPIALKDLIELAGYDTTAGSATRRGLPPSTITSTIANRLVDAGAVLLGKVHTAEFAFGAWGDNEHMGTPWNPWDLQVQHTPGGSSSGSGVAVAACMAPVAIGTDTGGSVRIPAGFNGLVGLKTTTGRISAYGVIPLSQTLDTPGVLARSVTDAALIYGVLQGHDDLDPRTWSRPKPVPNTLPLDDLSDLRLACLCEADRVGIDEDVLAAYDRCLGLLESLGASIVILTLERPLISYAEPTPMAVEAFALYGELAQDPSSLMDPQVRKRVLGGNVSATEYLKIREVMTAQTVDFHRRLTGLDAFILPTSQVPAVPLSGIGTRPNASLLTRFGNTFGLCGVAMPSGYNHAGLPLSLQILCRGYQEDSAMRIASALEIRTSDERHYPEL